MHTLHSHTYVWMITVDNLFFSTESLSVEFLSENSIVVSLY